MTDSPTEKARHAAHEMVGFMLVHQALHDRDEAWCDSEVVIHALRTAYATHVRNLLEFFHEKKDGDTVYSDLLSGHGNPFKAPKKTQWPQTHQDWWLQATKLASHLAGNRSDFGDLPEWEERGCEAELMPMIHDAAQKIPQRLRHGSVDVAAALQAFGGWEDAQ